MATIIHIEDNTQTKKGIYRMDLEDKKFYSKEKIVISRDMSDAINLQNSAFCFVDEFGDGKEHLMTEEEIKEDKRYDPLEEETKLPKVKDLVEWLESYCENHDHGRIEKHITKPYDKVKNNILPRLKSFNQESHIMII